jgi:hypothetical protein
MNKNVFNVKDLNKELVDEFNNAQKKSDSDFLKKIRELSKQTNLPIKVPLDSLLKNKGGYQEIKIPFSNDYRVGVWLDKDGLKSNDNGPAIVGFYADKPEIKIEEYHMKDGKMKDGESLIIRNGKGQEVIRANFKNDKLIKTRSKTIDGNWFVEEVGGKYLNIWDEDEKGNRFTRTGVPTITSYDEEGNLHSESWMNDKKQFHRTDGPAVIHYNSDGLPRSNVYFLNGQILDTDEYNKMSLEQRNNFKRSNASDTTNNMNTVKDKLKIAGQRIATRKLVKGLQALLVDQMTKGMKGKTKSSAMEGLNEFFASQAGKGMISMLIGGVLPYAKTIPQLSKYEKTIDSLAEEFQVEGMSVVGEEALDTVMELGEQAIPLLKGFFEEQEAKEQVRVEAVVEETVKTEDHEHEAELKTAKEDLKKKK